jgi:LuxR family transcriptional regulator, maltose regulon positive regulatory protein
LVNAFLLEAITRDSLGDPAAAGAALERALDAVEPDLIVFPFLVFPAPRLLERHACKCPKHAALVSQILSLPPAADGERGRPAGPGGAWGTRSVPMSGGIPPPRLPGAAEPPGWQTR